MSIATQLAATRPVAQIQPGALSLRVYEKAERREDLAEKVKLEDMALPVPGPEQALIEVYAAGVNPSDIKAVLGIMPHAVWPRMI